MSQYIRSSRERVFYGLLVLGATLLSACVPYAWIAPPVRTHLAVGHAAKVSGPAANKGENDQPSAVSLSVAVHPLGMFPSLKRRPFDIGVGYLMYPHNSEEDSQTSHMFLHGPYLELSWHLVQGFLFDSSRWGGRVGLHIQPRFLMSDLAGRQTMGFGASAKLSGELVFITKGDPFAGCGLDGCNFGFLFGELTFGLSIESGAIFINNSTFVDTRVGFVLTIPLTMGVGFFFTDRRRRGRRGRRRGRRRRRYRRGD